jgi:hypothetical protein
MQRKITDLSFQMARQNFIESFLKRDENLQKKLFEIYYSAYDAETVKKIVKSAEKEYEAFLFWKERM